MHASISHNQNLARIAARQSPIRTISRAGHFTKSPAIIGALYSQQNRGIRVAQSSRVVPPEPDWTSRTTHTNGPPPPSESSSDLHSAGPPRRFPNTLDRYVINTFSQGIVLDAESRNKRDPQYVSAEGGRQVRLRGSGSPLDAASAENGVSQMRPRNTGRGNKEGVGFVEQVGSASATARWFEKGWRPMDVGTGIPLEPEVTAREEREDVVEDVGGATETERMLSREALARAPGVKMGRGLAQEHFENARAAALARKLVA